jgi:hypothetical protein
MSSIEEGRFMFRFRACIGNGVLDGRLAVAIFRGRCREKPGYSPAWSM